MTHDPAPGVASHGSELPRHTPRMVRAMQMVEQNQALDAAVDALSPMAAKLVDTPGKRRLLLGNDMGHAIHPVLTDLPIGFWTSATVLDLAPTPGGARAARRLIALGVLSAVPAAVTGWAEWSRTDREVRRVGVVHAAQNTVALSCFSASWLARRSGRHGWGKALGLVGAVAVTMGGTLGGYLAIGKKVGSTHRVDGASAEG